MDGLKLDKSIVDTIDTEQGKVIVDGIVRTGHKLGLVVLAEGVALTDAGRQDIDYEPCIMAAFERDGYRCVYFVSAASGLLRAASFYRGETLTRRVEVSDLQTELPDEGLFTLPEDNRY